MTSSSKPFKRGTKICERLWRQPISPYWLVRWSGPLKHFGPLKGWGGGGWGQGLHLGAPGAQTTLLDILWAGLMTYV